MTDAPKRIHLDGDSEAGEGMFPRCFENPKYCSEPAIEYIRADLVHALEAENQRLREALSTIAYHTAFLDREWLSADLNSRLDAARAALNPSRDNAASGPAAFKSRRTVSGAGMTLEERQEMVDDMNRRQRAMEGREPDLVAALDAEIQRLRGALGAARLCLDFMAAGDDEAAGMAKLAISAMARAALSGEGET